MNTHINILKSKLTIPRISTLLERERLLSDLSEMMNNKLTVVTAGAGYGKTTLIAQTVRRYDFSTVWYSLDRSDTDFTIFMIYLITGVQKCYPDFFKRNFEPVFNATLSRQMRETFLIEFLNEMETIITDDLIIVLDDYYLVQESEEINDALKFILERLPERIHLVVISRVDPPLNISKYRSQMAVKDIGNNDLGFRTDEIEKLYKKLANLDMDEKDIHTIYRKTEGWVAGLILFMSSIKGKDLSVLERHLDIKGTGRYIFQFFDENIFQHQPRTIQTFLLKTSVLSRLETDFCDRLLKIENSDAVLRYLSDNHLFTSIYDEETLCYYYHHLLKEFLVEKFNRSFSKEDIAAHYYKIGMLMEDSGGIIEAIFYYLEGENYLHAAKLLKQIDIRDILKSQLKTLFRYLNRIPERILIKDPDLIYLKARIESFRGNVYESIEGLKLSLAIYRKQKNQSGINNCLKDLGYQYFITGSLRKALMQMDELFESSQGKSPMFLVEVAGYLILFSSIKGDMEAADGYYQTAGQLEKGFSGFEKMIVRSYIKFCRGFQMILSGKFKTSYALNKESFDVISDLPGQVFLPFVSFQLSLTSYYLNKFEEGLFYAESGMKIAARQGIYDHQYPLLIFARGLNRIGLKQFDCAMDDANQSLALFDGYDYRWGQAHSYHLFYKIYMLTGNPDDAEISIQKGLSLLRGLSFKTTEGKLQIALAHVMISRNNMKEACTLLSQAIKNIAVSDYYLFKAYYYESIAFSAIGEDEKAFKKLQKALNIAVKHQYPPPEIPLPEKIETTIGNLYENPSFRPYIGAHFQNILTSRIVSKPSDATADTAQFGKPALKNNLSIQLLGAFVVYQDGRRIEAETWKSKKAEMIFKYLAYHRKGGFVPREVLMELLWPEEDVEKIKKRFNVAMSALRKILEPDLKKGESSLYIKKQKDAYRLDIGPSGRVDTERFLDLLQLAETETDDPEKNIRHLQDAVSLYKGVLLEEDLYEDWCISEREFMNEKYLLSLEKIILFYEKQNEFQKGIDFARKYLAVDKYAEHIYRALMRLYSSSGNMPAVIKTYERCRKIIETEIQCPIDERTKTLYNQLTSSG